jgi:ribonuclease P protein component
LNIPAALNIPLAIATPRMEPDSLREDERPAPAGGRPGRLTRRAEFQRVSGGRRASAQTFTLQSRRRDGPEAEAGGARVGFTVTRKVGNAVVRNRIRRRLREALRAAWPLEAQADHDYVLMARREALGRRFAALVDDVRQAFRTARRDGADGAGRASAGGKAKDKDKRP